MTAPRTEITTFRCALRRFDPFPRHMGSSIGYSLAYRDRPRSIDWWAHARRVVHAARRIQGYQHGGYMRGSPCWGRWCQGGAGRSTRGGRMRIAAGVADRHRHRYRAGQGVKGPRWYAWA